MIMDVKAVADSVAKCSDWSARAFKIAGLNSSIFKPIHTQVIGCQPSPFHRVGAFFAMITDKWQCLSVLNTDLYFSCMLAM